MIIAPAAFYNGAGRTVLFSPLNNYMVGMQAVSKNFQNDLAFGIIYFALFSIILQFHGTNLISNRN